MKRYRHMATFREYMAEEAAKAKQKITAAKDTTGGMSSADVQELFRLQDIVYLNDLAMAEPFGNANRRESALAKKLDVGKG